MDGRNELELIDRFVRRFERGGRGLVAGPGDDCAILRPTRGMEICATTDTVREGVHFGPRFLPGDIGHKALAVNLSDLAAMGASPRWFLVALELPPCWTGPRIDALAAGMARLAAIHGCHLAGGNVCRADALAITLTALGELPAGTALRRDGLRPGDLLAVTGRLGSAALGLRRLRRRRGGGEEELAQLRPEPRVAVGLAARGIASAAIDLSDGLAQDLPRLCRASSCGAEIWAEALPVSRAVARQRDRLELCLGGGEDYELLLGLSEGRLPELLRRVARVGVPLTVIGRATKGRALRLSARQGEALGPLPERGWAHF